MSINGLENYSYPKQLEFFDSERRGRRGLAYAEAYDDPPSDWPENRVFIMGEKYDAYIQQYTLDCTGTSENNPKKITTFSLANGCKHVLKYHGPVTIGSDDSMIQCSEYWEDKDGNRITEYNIKEFSIPSSSKYNENAYNRTVWISPPSANWHSVGGGGNGEAYSFNYVPNFIWKVDNASPYPPPDLNGIIGYQNFSTYYYMEGRSSNNSDVYIDWLNALNNAGDGLPITSQLPSEDISTPGGGDDVNPDYNPYSDNIDFPGLPTGGSAIASGFIRVYSPTSAQLQGLASKLWGNDFVNTIHKIMNDPMEAMVSLHSVPFQIVGGSNANIEVGNFDTEISAKTVTSQYYTLDCGNISLPEHWASALDYSPYTTVDIFIPFVGVRPLQIDDVMGRVLNLKYNIDVLTGCAIAMLKCGDSVLYTYNTQVHTEIPYTMSSYGRLVQSIIGVAGTAIGATAGGAGALIGASIGGALGTAMTKHSDISRGGSLGGAVGVMGDFTPYLIIHRPIQSLASDFASKKGYPANISATLSSVSGYTVVDKIHLTDIDCTDNERDEIHTLLKEGVII